VIEGYVNRLFYKEDGSGPAVLLIHGGSSHADVWGDSFRLIAADHRAIAYDRRGYTRSRPAATANHHRHGEDAAALLAALGAAPATVVGWSSGGVVALDLAINHPDLVASLVLIEPTYMLRRSGTLGFYRTVGRLFLAQIRRRPERGAELFLRWVNGYTTGGSSFDRLDEDLQASLTANGRTLAADYRPSRAPGSGEYLRKRIAGISCPVTLMRAELSEPTLQRCAERLERSLPEVEVVQVPGTSHSLALERPDAFVAAVRQASSSTALVGSA
jgi:pimeloyl-ACP methyl ester carboxylesterase